MRIDIGETHIRLESDIENHGLENYIRLMRNDLKRHISLNGEFLTSLEPLKNRSDDLPLIVRKMYESSDIADVGPMACVAGTVSELSLEYLISKNSKTSVVENGGDIALVNDRKILCGIYSGNEFLGSDIAFEIKKRKTPLGICTSSGKIGHSISFGTADSVTVISPSASLSDALATRIANEVTGITGEDKVSNALETADEYRKYFRGVLIVCDSNVATAGHLPDIVSTRQFDNTF